MLCVKGQKPIQIACIDCCAEAFLHRSHLHMLYSSGVNIWYICGNVIIYMAEFIGATVGPRLPIYEKRTRKK